MKEGSPSVVSMGRGVKGTCMCEQAGLKLPSSCLMKPS